MTNHPYLKPGGVSILFHSILIFLLTFYSATNIAAPAAEVAPVEVDFEPAQLITTQNMTIPPDSPAPSSAPQAGGGGAPGKLAPSARPVTPTSLPNLPALSGGNDQNSVALPALAGNGSSDALGSGGGTEGQGGGGGSGGGTGSGTGEGSGSGEGSGEGYVGASGRYQPKPAYPPAARKAGREGSVLVEVEIDEDGLPAEVTVVDSSGDQDFDEAAVTGVRRWRFSPARRDGQPVASTKQFRVRFCLNDAE